MQWRMHEGRMICCTVELNDAIRGGVGLDRGKGTRRLREREVKQ